jgi:hypothetical protein
MSYKTKEISPKWKTNINSLPDKKITRELTPKEEKTAFLYTSKVNSAKVFVKYLN